MPQSKQRQVRFSERAGFLTTQQFSAKPILLPKGTENGSAKELQLVNRLHLVTSLRKVGYYFIRTDP